MIEEQNKKLRKAINDVNNGIDLSDGYVDVDKLFEDILNGKTYEKKRH